MKTATILLTVTALLAALKLYGVLVWPWSIVLLPLWLPALLFVVTCLAVITMLAIVAQLASLLDE